MKLTFLGAAHEVTGSCTLLEGAGRRILIDCGMEQGADTYENMTLPLAATNIDCILLTHAHIDHSGKLPSLVARGFRGPIYATGATKRLCDIMLLDSAHIQEMDAEWRNRKAKRAGDDTEKPPYTVSDVEQTMKQFVSCSYGEKTDIFDGISVRFIDAGHLLGSASIEISVTENGVTELILFSGDIGNIDRPLIRDPQKPEKADFVVIESTYGDRLHGARGDYVSQLTSVIQRTLDRGGNLVIPSFAVGRTQEMLYLIHQIKSEGRIKNHPGFPVWVDSPLAVEATKIYSGDMMEYYDAQTLDYIAKGENILTFDGLRLSVTSDESKAINFDNTPKVIISSSGMCDAGRIRHHLKHNLWRKESTVLFVGYQSEGTLGRLLIDGAWKVKLFGEEIAVEAEIAQMDGISGHADKNMLLNWLKNIETPPKKVFVNHGSDAVCDRFAADIENTLGISAFAPYNGAVYDLTADELIERGNTQRIVKGTSKKRSSPAFEKLLSAGRRLIAVIERCRGYANKDLAKFTNQINELCKKWER